METFYLEGLYREPEDIATVIQLQERLIRDKERLREKNRYNDIVYVMKDGSIMRRQYANLYAEENLDLNSGAGKREYSDVAMKLLRYVRDAVERKHYEQLVARKLDCSVEDLRAKRVDTGARKRLKKVTTTALPDYLKGMRDDLEALMVYGGVTGIHGVEVAQDETRLKELELIFEARYKGWAPEALEQEAQALLKRYKQEMNRRAVEELQERLAEAEAKGDEREAEEILRQIMALKKA